MGNFTLCAGYIMANPFITNVFCFFYLYGDLTNRLIQVQLTDRRAPSKSVVTGSSNLFCRSFSSSGVKRSIDELVWIMSRT